MDWPQHESRLVAQPHMYTKHDQLPHRCLDAIYLLTLLESGFGFKRNDSRLTLALEVGGKEVEWTLGFLLARLADGSAANH